MDPTAVQHVTLSQNKKHNDEEAEENIVLLAATLSATAAAQYFAISPCSPVPDFETYLYFQDQVCHASTPQN
jgi:hypothetical protein